MLGLASIPSFLQWIGMLFLPESQRWLTSKGKYEQARKTLKLIYTNSMTLLELLGFRYTE